MSYVLFFFFFFPSVCVCVNVCDREEGVGGTRGIGVVIAPTGIQRKSFFLLDKTEDRIFALHACY